MTPSHPRWHACAHGAGSGQGRDAGQGQTERNARNSARRAARLCPVTSRPFTTTRRRRGSRPCPACPAPVARRRGGPQPRAAAAMAAATAGRTGQRQLVAREQAHGWAVFEGEHADAVELALERPGRIGEAGVGERGRHRFEPIGDAHGLSSLCECDATCRVRPTSLPSRAPSRAAAWSTDFPGPRGYPTPS